jgi:ParB family chromosome partitioning protein
MSIYDKLGAKTAGIKARSVEKPADKPPRTAPGMFLNAAQRIDAAESRVEELEARLKDAEANGGSREIVLDDLHEVSTRRRRLSSGEYIELKENLRNNPLVQAITVRPRAEGGFEIVSGHNRVAIYRELGRSTILATVQAMDEERADLGGFYANLLHPSLPDFEKYLGFKRRQERTGKTQKELAEEAGLPVQTLSDLFSFEKLPPEVRDMLDQRPHLLGSSAAGKLAQAAGAGRGQAVIEAVQKLATEENFTQAQAVAHANKIVSAPKAKPQASVIRNGKKTFCKIEARGSKLVIDFTEEAVAGEWAGKLEEFLRAQAKEVAE